MPDGMTPAGPPGDASSALTDAVFKLGEGRTGLVDAYDNCLEAVRIGSVHLFPSALATIQRILDEIGKVVQAALEAVRWIFEHYGPGMALHVQSFNWIRNVAEPVSGIRSDMTVNAGEGPPRERRLRAGPGDPGGRPGARAGQGRHRGRHGRRHP